MKRFAVLLGILVLAQSANAERFRNVRLEARVTPLPAFAKKDKKAIVQVYSDGEVKGYLCAEKQPCTAARLARLTAYEMDALERDISTARWGKLDRPGPGTKVCKALPFESRSYTADNGRILLQKGNFPCGLTTTNRSPAAKKLLGLLQRFENQLRYPHLD